MSDLIATSAHVDLFRAADDMPARDALLALARERSADPEVFAEAEPWFFMVDASNTRLDAHYTEMDPTTLENFARNAGDGVAVLKSHDHREHYGSSLTGEVVKRGGETIFRSVFFTMQDVAGPEILKIRSGIYKDVSVGFRVPADGMIVCSICGGNMMDWTNCTHWPGRNYEVEEKGKKTTKLATGRIVNGLLSEYSTVYDGSTPGAGVLKGLRMAEAGEMSPELAASLERTYSRAFPVHRSYAVPEIGVQPTRKVEDMEEGMDQVRALLQERGFHVRAGSDAAAIVEQLKNHLADLDREASDRQTAIQERDTEIARLKPLAEDGERYREDVVEAALENYVRTLDPETRKTANTDHWRRAFQNMDIPDIQAISDDWERHAVFEAGAGSKPDGSGNPPATKPAPTRSRRARLAARAHSDA